MELLIVSGLSGAGKSVAMNALEDIGYLCIDNIPAALLPSITAFSKAGDNQLERVALCMDVRGCRTREEIEQALQQLDVKLLYWIGFRNSDRAKFRKEWLCEKRYRNNSGAIKANVAI